MNLPTVDVKHTWNHAVCRTSGLLPFLNIPFSRSAVFGTCWNLIPFYNEWKTPSVCPFISWCAAGLFHSLQWWAMFLWAPVCRFVCVCVFSILTAWNCRVTWYLCVGLLEEPPCCSQGSHLILSSHQQWMRVQLLHLLVNTLFFFFSLTSVLPVGVNYIPV